MGSKVDKTKRALIGAGGRILFYPTLFYNLVRFKLQSQFRWWDQTDEYLLMGAVPFRKDVSRLKHLGVGGVITLNEPFETLVPSSLYNAYEMEHLVIPTCDYLFAPLIADITRAVNFIHITESTVYSVLSRVVMMIISHLSLMYSALSRLVSSMVSSLFFMRQPNNVASLDNSGSVSDPETPGCCNPKTLLLLKPSDDLMDLISFDDERKTKNDKDCSNEETDTAARGSSSSE